MYDWDQNLLNKTTVYLDPRMIPEEKQSCYCRIHQIHEKVELQWTQTNASFYGMTTTAVRENKEIIT